jgi:putative acetyltransferase
MQNRNPWRHTAFATDGALHPLPVGKTSRWPKKGLDKTIKIVYIWFRLSLRPGYCTLSAVVIAVNKPMYSFRHATFEDSAAVQALVESVLREYGLAFDADDTDADLADLQANYEGRGGVFYVVESQAGAVVGCGGLFPMNTHAVELRKMYLLPAARGRGLGKELLQRLLADARRLGYKRIILETNSALKDAIALYRRFGFMPLDRSHLAERCDQAWEFRLAAQEDEGEITQ